MPGRVLARITHRRTRAKTQILIGAPSLELSDPLFLITTGLAGVLLTFAPSQDHHS